MNGPYLILELMWTKLNFHVDILIPYMIFLMYGKLCLKLGKIRSLSNFPENSTDPQALLISPETYFLWIKSTEMTSVDA